MCWQLVRVALAYLPTGGGGELFRVPRGTPPMSLAINSLPRAVLVPLFALHRVLSGSLIAVTPPSAEESRAQKYVSSSVETPLVTTSIGEK